MGTDAQVKRLDEGPLRLGSRFRVDSPTLGATVWKVSKWEPNRSLSLEEGWLLMKTLRDYELEILDSRQTRATVDVAPVGPLYWPIILAQLLFRPSGRNIELELQTLKRVSER